MRWLISLALVVCTSFCMAFPFTPHTTFTDDATPAIDADFLNDLQDQGVAPAAAVSYYQIPVVDMKTSAGTTISYSAFAVMVEDSVTGKYGYVQMPAGTLTDADYTASPGTFPANSWLFAYAYSVSGTGYVELSLTDPTADRLTKFGDTTRRYLFSVRTGGGATLFNMARYNRYTRFLDIVDIFGTSGAYSAWSTTPNVIDCSAKWPTSAQAADVHIDAIGSTADAGAGVYGLTLAAAGFDQYYEPVAPDNAIGETYQFYVAGYTTLTATSTAILTNAKGYIRMLGWWE